MGRILSVYMAKTLIDKTGLPEAVEKKARAKEMPVLVVEGDAVTRYNHAVDQKKKAETVMQELRSELIVAGLKFVAEHNAKVAEPAEMIQSVRLKAHAEPGEGLTEELCTFTLSNKVGKLEHTKIAEALEPMRRKDGKVPDINDYVEWDVAAYFDTSIFIGKSGMWSQTRYAAVLEALQAVADAYFVDNPLSCAKQLQVKKEWFTLRFADFTPKQNLALAKVIPCATTLEPVRPAKPEVDE